MLDFTVTIRCIVNESLIKPGEEIIVHCDRTKDQAPKEEKKKKARTAFTDLGDANAKKKKQ